ncbi:hypothetical protein MBLNU230_g1976t1 [Neophaeotheca triangularis]
MASHSQQFTSKTRVFILSDISNEPDDAESLCRYLLYSNQFNTEGLVACTSTWLRNKVFPQDMEKIIDAYAGAVDNLNKHAHPSWQYPSAQHLKSLVRKGAETYGMTAVREDVPLSAGGELLLKRIESTESSLPLWVLCWGGTNTLAQVLHYIARNYKADEAKELRSRLRVYAISDQDDTGVWIRQSFPDIFYIASVHGWNSYGMAAWTGISGEQYYGFDQGGPDSTKIQKQWIKDNIQIGPLGSAYPDPMFIPEGDTPTFLYLIQNGLGVPEHPSYGSWGGRYARTDDSDVSEAPGGVNSKHYTDTVDTVKGQDGKMYTSNQATIWRWRDAFQNDFAARIKWSIEADFTKTTHHPVININGTLDLAPLYLEAEASSTITLDASATYSPDSSGQLSFKWWHYKQPTAIQWWVDAEVKDLGIKKLDDEGRRVEVTLPEPGECCTELLSRAPKAKGQLLHLVLEVTNDGVPPLTSYRRVLIQATNPKLLGGGQGGDSIADVMQSAPST